MVFQEIYALFLAHSYLASFVAGALSEDILLLLAIASGGSNINFLTLCIFGFVGAIIHDTLIYVVAKFRPFKKWMIKLEKKEGSKPLVLFIEKVGRGDYLIPLVISKFIYGTRIALIFYSAHKEKSFWRYFFANTFFVFIWFIIMMPLGWLAGRGFTQILGAVHTVEKVVGFMVLFILLAIIFNSLFKNTLLKYRN